MLLQLVTIAVLINGAHSAVQGTVQSTYAKHCGSSITGSVNGGESNAHAWVFQLFDPATVTFSTCNSAHDFTEGLKLYDWSLDGSESTEIGDCYHSDGTGTGCDVCAGTSYLTNWTVPNLGPSYEQFYIEIYSYTSGFNSYTINIDCVVTPTTSSPTSTTGVPTTMQPTTVTPTTNMPTTLQPTTNIPTTALPTTINTTTMSPTTAVPTTSLPTTSQPTTLNPTTFLPTTFEPTTPNPTTSEPTTVIPTTYQPTTTNPTTATPTSAQLVDNPTPPPTTAADGEAKNTMENTSEKHDAKTNDTNAFQMDTETLLLIVIIFLVIIILIGGLCCFLCFLKNKKKNAAIVNKNYEANDIEIAQMVPIDGPKTKTGMVTETGTGTSTANGKELMRVGSVSLSGERENVTGTNVNVDVTDETGTDTDNDMYDQDDVTPNINNSPSSFVITPESKSTAGNIGVDFMDMKDMNSEGDILNEEENNEDNMDEMYGKENKYKTAGGKKDVNDKMYQKSGNKITKS